MTVLRRNRNVQVKTPACIVHALDQCAAAAPQLQLSAGGASYATGDVARHKKIITFLAGDDGRRVWIEVRRLVKTDAEFEAEAALLLVDVMLYAPNAERITGKHTRNDLRGLDNAVVKAADHLIAALAKHPDLLPVPSSQYWTPQFRKWIGDNMSLDLRERNDGAPLSSFRNFVEPQPSNALGWLEQNAPTLTQLLDGLRNRAADLSTRRILERKLRQTDDARLQRDLLSGLINRHRDAAPYPLAKIVAPIVDVYYPNRDSFGAAHTMARDLKRHPA